MELDSLTNDMKEWKNNLNLCNIATLTDEILQQLVDPIPRNENDEDAEMEREWRKYAKALDVHTALFLPLSFYQSYFISRMVVLSFRSLGKDLIKRAQRQWTGKIRVGFLSPDITKVHPMPGIVLPWIVRLAKRNVDVVLFDISEKKYMTRADKRYLEYVKRMVKGDDHFVDLRTETTQFFGTCKDKANKLAEIAAKISAQRLDVLVDLSGLHTYRGMVQLAERHSESIADVYVVPGVALAATTGCRKVHYYGTDKTSVPEEFANCFSERLAYIPGTYFHVGFKEMFPHILNIKHYETEGKITFVLNSNGEIPDLSTKNQEKIAKYLKLEGQEKEKRFRLHGKNFVIRYQRYDVSLRPDDADIDIDNGMTTWADDEVVVTARCQYGLPEKYKIMANFNNPKKWILSEWEHMLTILDKCKDTILWVRHENKDDIKKHLEDASRDLAGRIYFANDVPKEEQLRRLQLVNVVTDCFPCNGHTTTADALFAGVPVVTREYYPDCCKASRVNRSIIGQGMKLPVLVAPDEPSYLDRIIAILRNKLWSDYLREQIRFRIERMNMFNPKATAEIWHHLFLTMLEDEKSGNQDRRPLTLPPRVYDKITSYEIGVERVTVVGGIARGPLFGTMQNLPQTPGKKSQGGSQPDEAQAELSRLATPNVGRKVQKERKCESDDDDDEDEEAEYQERDGESEGSESSEDAESENEAINQQSPTVESVREKARLMVYRMRELFIAAEDVFGFFLKGKLQLLDTSLSVMDILTKINNYADLLLQIEEEDHVFVSYDSYMLKIEHIFPGSNGLHYCPLCKKKKSMTSINGHQNHFNNSHSYRTKSKKVIDKFDPKAEVKEAMEAWSELTSVSTRVSVFPRGIIAYHQKQAFENIHTGEKVKIGRKDTHKLASINFNIQRPTNKPKNYCKWVPLMKPIVSASDLLQKWTTEEQKKETEETHKGRSSSNLSGKKRPRKDSEESEDGTFKNTSASGSGREKKRSKN